jgi:hypothetical protein
LPYPISAPYGVEVTIRSDFPRVESLLRHPGRVPGVPRPRRGSNRYPSRDDSENLISECRLPAVQD